MNSPTSGVKPDWAAADAILTELARQAGVTTADWEWAESVFDRIEAERNEADN